MPPRSDGMRFSSGGMPVAAKADTSPCPVVNRETTAWWSAIRRCLRAKKWARADGGDELSSDEVPERWDRTLHVTCLCLIVVQNSSLILVTSYSRMLSPAYLASVAVFFAEVLKLSFAFALLALEARSVRAAAHQCCSLLREHSIDTLKFAVPALCYTLQNNLWYYALSRLDPVTAAVTSQMKVITTAIASVLILGRRLTTRQWHAPARLRSLAHAARGCREALGRGGSFGG